MKKFFSIVLLCASFVAVAHQDCSLSCTESCAPTEAIGTPSEESTASVTEDTVRNILENNGHVSFVFSFKCMEGCSPEKRNHMCSMVMDCIQKCQNSPENKNSIKDIMPTICAMCDIVEDETCMRGEMSVMVGMPNPEDCSSDCSSSSVNEPCCTQPALSE